MENYKGVKSFDELLDKKYGVIGTTERNEFEERSHMFIISEMLKQARKEEKMTHGRIRPNGSVRMPKCARNCGHCSTKRGSSHPK